MFQTDNRSNTRNSNTYTLSHVAGLAAASHGRSNSSINIGIVPMSTQRSIPRSRMQLTTLFALALVSVAAAAPTQLTGRATQNVYTIHPNGDTTKCVGVLGGALVVGAAADMYVYVVSPAVTRNQCSPERLTALTATAPPHRNGTSPVDPG
jgi:hypothetical protein